MTDASASVPLTCKVVVPNRGSSLEGIVSRWSNSEVHLPALVVIPDHEEDIVGAIRYAKKHGLRVVPACGGHGNFVPIDSNTLYLDMKKFNGVRLDRDGGLVHIGGGTVTGDVVRVCSAEGYYTTWPNSNAVGMVGCVLGGGNSPLAGIHGFMVDNVVSFRLINAEGKTLELSASSSGDEAALFNALCGAGHGFGVVTSMTMKAYPMSALKMDDNKIWARRLIFPPTAIRTAAQAFIDLQPPPPNMLIVLLYMRSPPGTPAPGAPMIMLTASCTGPSEVGEKSAASLFDPAVTEKAIKAETVQTPFASANAAFEFINSHGDYKDVASCFVQKLDPDTIVAGFSKWVDFTDAHEDAKRTITAIGGSNTEKLRELGRTAEAQAKFFEVRDRGFYVCAFAWCTQADTREAMSRYEQEMVALYRRDDPGVPRTFANNMLPWTPREWLYSNARVTELERLKQTWDSSGIFWSPNA